MKVIICGAGQVGWQIARYLCREDNDVTLVDKDPDLIRRATETLDVAGITGFASYPDILERAGARDADMLIAATYSDEVNMVTCQVAHSIFGVTQKIARLRAQNYLEALYSDLYRRDHMPIEVVISPEKEVAEAALGLLEVPAAFDSEDFLDGKAKLLGLHIDEDCPVIYTALRQLSDLFSTLATIVVGVRRQGQLFAPTASDQIFPGDRIYVLTRTADLNRTLEVFGKTARRCERVVIIGGGNVGLEVAQRLETGRERIRARVIEQDVARAELAADQLERTIVLHGDGADPQLLDEARIAQTDAVLCVTDDDRANMLAAVRAKQMGAKMAICLTNDPGLEELLTPMGIDANINPRSTTVSSILRHIRHGRIRSVYSIGDAEAEMIEAQILSTSPLAGKTIRESDIPDGVLIGGILRHGEMLKPTGSTRLEEGDRVAIFATSKHVSEVEALLQVSIDFY